MIRDVTLLALSVLPSLVAVGILLLLPRKWVRQSVCVSVTLAGLSALSSLALLVTRFSVAEPMQNAVQWLAWNGGGVRIGYYVDSLTLMMLACVAVIGCLVQVYSVWYMKDDPAKRRYFGTISFFTFAMLCFVVSGNLLESYIFWELIGFSSYLLIGFWHERPAPRRAAIKAFVMTRFGDLGFLGAVIILLIQSKILHVDYLIDYGPAEIAFLIDSGGLGGGPSAFHAFSRDCIVCLLFLGVIGKSAQFPLSSWLPDAMEGPTPVSALIHSATMVAAGVYLLVRIYPLIALSQVGLTLILVVGAVTSVIAAMQALTARDMKRILAYSTVSQLGFMIMAIGAGAVNGAMFHLLTHAVFKSMLFLLAGYFISVAHHSNDIFEMAKLPRGSKSRWMVTLLWIGGLALCGLFPFSGFMSKESIFSHLLEEHQYKVYGVGLAISFLTSYYTMRMMCVVSRNGGAGVPSPRLHVSDRGEGTPAPLIIPVTLLGLFTVLGFWALLPWLQSYFHLPVTLDHEFWMNFAITSSVVLLGLFTGWCFFGKSTSSELGWVAWCPLLARVIERKFFVDDFWEWIMRRGVYGLADVGAWCEKYIINAAVNGIGNGLLAGGQQVAGMQTGPVQKYLLISILGVIGVILYLTLS